MNKPLVRLQGVGKSFADRTVLHNISLVINRGEITTIIGPNGAGKSSLVRIILGLLTADTGSVERAENLKVGYMPQKIHVDPTLPLNALRFLQLDSASVEDCRHALDLVGIAHVSDTSFRSLSGGEIQRLLLARAVLRNPHLLVLDEPVQGVDINGQNQLYSMIAQLSRELNCGVLMVSHDLHLVMSASDHVICLNQHICCQGKPEQVTRDPAYIDIFGESSVYSHQHNYQHNAQEQVVDTEGNQGQGECCNHD